MPQPIDPTTEINRAAAVERLQQLTARTDLHAQTRQAHMLAQQELAAETNVDRPEAKSDEVERDLRRRNPYVGRRKRRNPDDSPSEESRTFYTPDERPAIAEDDDHHGLDVTV